MTQFLFLHICQLRLYAYVFSLPESVYNYQFLSSAVSITHIEDVFHDGRETWTFLSFMIGLPVLAVIAYLIIILSIRKEIKEKLKDTAEHQNFAALISLGITVAWFATSLDILALASYEHDPSTMELYYSHENNSNNKLFRVLIASAICECIVIIATDIFPLLNGCRGVWYCRSKLCTLNLFECAGRLTAACLQEDKEVHFWTFMLPLISLVWCLSSHFGFIVIAWTSFVRHSTAFTVFYIFAVVIMFLISRQSYTLIIDSYYAWKYREDDVTDKKRENGIAIWAIWILRLEAALLVGFFAYLMFGLWLLPVAEVVEDAPAMTPYS